MPVVFATSPMEQAVADGKIRSIGLSNWYVKELEEFLPQVSITPALVQNEIHPYYQENDVIPFIQNLGIVVQGWYPLGGRGHTSELLGDKVISGIAEMHGKSSAQVILRWNLQKGVVVIPGSSNPNHIKENTELFDFELTNEDMERINVLDRNEKHDWYDMILVNFSLFCPKSKQETIINVKQMNTTVIKEPDAEPITNEDETRGCRLFFVGRITYVHYFQWSNLHLWQ